MIWSPAAKSALRDLWVAPGATIAVIREALLVEHGLAVTRSAVIGAARRAGLSHQGPPTMQAKAAARYAADPDASRERRRARRREALAAKAAPMPKPAPAQKAAPAPRPALGGAPTPLGIPLVEARAQQCRFIADDLRGDGRAVCCGHPTAEGGSWCSWHRRVCTLRPSRPVNAWIPDCRRAA